MNSLAYAAANGKNYLFAPKNLGTTVNSGALEYWPYISIDGSEIGLPAGSTDKTKIFISAKKSMGNGHLHRRPEAPSILRRVKQPKHFQQTDNG